VSSNGETITGAVQCVHQDVGSRTEDRRVLKTGLLAAAARSSPFRASQGDANR